ncbi:MAG: hypothetical protein ACRCX2_24005 [Paraclostridium sp.]
MIITKEDILGLEFIYEEKFIEQLHKFTTPQGCRDVNCRNCQINRIRLHFDIGCNTIMELINKRKGEYGRVDDNITTGVQEMSEFLIAYIVENGSFWRL